MNLPCEVILDLIPLCKDNVASDESCHFVEKHIAKCTSCRHEYESIESVVNSNTPMPDEKQFLRKLRLNILKLQGILLIVGAVLGVSMTFSINMFYNFLLMPVVGLLSFRVFRRKFYMAPAFVFVLSIISNCIYGMFSDGYNLTEFKEAFVSWAIYSAIYASLVFIGWCIGWLLHYAFSSDKNSF